MREIPGIFPLSLCRHCGGNWVRIGDPMSRTPSVRPRQKTVPARGVTKRLEIEMPPGDIETLSQVASWTGQSTLTAVVRDALKAYVWMVTEQRRNRRIISENYEREDRMELMPLLKASVFAKGEPTS